jgi:preprotein translocase subunit SecG
MANVLIVAYLLIVLALITVILLQRSEGGGLGMGGGGGAGLLTVRGSANLLTRTTAILAALFMATAIGLTMLNELDSGSSGIFERADNVGEGAGDDVTVLDRLNEMSGFDEGLAVPETAPPPAAEPPPAPSSDPALAVPPTASPATDAPAAGEAPAAPIN